MKKNIKKLIILSIIPLTILVGLFAYFNYKPYESINKEVYSFNYPKELEISGGDVVVGAGYVNYRITNPDIPESQSSIQIRLPIEGVVGDSRWGLSYDLKNSNDSEFISLIKDIELNKHSGEIVEYRVDRQLPGDSPIHADFIKIYLDSQYPDAPIFLQYFKQDIDPDSLNEAWEMILDTLKY